jgi:hypothetical protein
VPLDVQAVLQPQRTEVVLGELAGQVAPRLIAELGHAAVDDLAIEVIVAVHARVTVGKGRREVSVSCYTKK